LPERAAFLVISEAARRRKSYKLTTDYYPEFLDNKGDKSDEDLVPDHCGILFGIDSHDNGSKSVDAIAAPLQEQMNTAGQELQQKAAQHIMEENLTAEHVAQDLNATAENLTEQAREKLNEELRQRIGQGLNLTGEQLSQRAEQGN